MPSFPGTDLLGGSGTAVQLPDGTNLPYGQLTKYERAVDTITFTINGTALIYVAPSEYYAKLIMAAMATIPLKPASFYVLSTMIPLYAVLSITPVTGAAAGGTAITVEGIGFVDGCTANLGGKAADVVFNSDIQLTVTSPPGTINTAYNLIVINPLTSERARSPEIFTYT